MPITDKLLLTMQENNLLLTHAGEHGPQQLVCAFLLTLLLKVDAEQIPHMTSSHLAADHSTNTPPTVYRTYKQGSK